MNHKEIEKKWQKYWEDKKTFKAITGSDKKPYYILVEFPYPSGSGLHVGHVRSYTAQDALSRMKRTGFKNKELLSFMAATVCKIHEYLIEQDITDGVCGYRELENWVLSYMVSNDLRRSAWTALLSKASMDREEQGTMERVFLLPHCDVD